MSQCRLLKLSHIKYFELKRDRLKSCSWFAMRSGFVVVNVYKSLAGDMKYSGGALVDFAVWGTSHSLIKLFFYVVSYSS